jgi:hypothetical protein
MGTPGKREVAVVVLLAAFLWSGAAAREPDGSVSFGYEWLDAKDSPSGLPTLRLTVIAGETLTGATLVAKAPPAISMRVGRIVSAGEGADLAVPGPGEPCVLGALARGGAAVVEFVLEVPPDAGGIASLTLEAVDASGRFVREGVGIPVGTVGVQPVLRNGALEFPAGTAPAKGP